MANVKTSDRTLGKRKGVIRCTAVTGWCVFILGESQNCQTGTLDISESLFLM